MDYNQYGEGSSSYRPSFGRVRSSSHDSQDSAQVVTAETAGGGAAASKAPKRKRATGDGEDGEDGGRTKRKGKKSKACLYCRRSHMVCDQQRPCARCIKRGIEALCTDQPAPSSADDSSAPTSKPSRPNLGNTQYSSTQSHSHHANGAAETQSGVEQILTSSPFFVPSNILPDGTGTGTANTNPNGSRSSIGERKESGSESSLRRPGATLQTPFEQLSSMSTILPPSLHPAWPLLPNNTVASAPDQDSWSWPQYPSSASTPSHLRSSFDPSSSQSYSFNSAPFSSQAPGEFGPLSDMLENLGIPSLPGGLGDIFGMGANRQLPDPSATPLSPAAVVATGGSPGWKGPHELGQNGAGGEPKKKSSKEVWEERGERAAHGEVGVAGVLNKVSRTDRYLLAAADQASGTRDERLALVIRAKYEAGLLKPYDYSRGYARMIKWMEKNVTPETKQAILKPLSIFRPAFRAIAQSLSDIDLIFVEEAFERLMLDYDRVFSAIHTPAVLWRRTGEIYKANKEFAVLTGIPAALLRSGKLGIYQLMSEESAVTYYKKFGGIAFDASHRSINTTCTLRIPHSLTRPPVSSAGQGTGGGGQGTPSLLPTPVGRSAGGSPALVPVAAEGEIDKGEGAELDLGAETPMPSGLGVGTTVASSGTGATAGGLGNGAGGAAQEYRTIKCCFSFTIRRDSWGIPIAVIGNWIPIGAP